MKQLDRERKKRKTKTGDNEIYGQSSFGDFSSKNLDGISSSGSDTAISSGRRHHHTTTMTTATTRQSENLLYHQSSNPTEVHTDDLVVRLLLSHFINLIKPKKKKTQKFPFYLKMFCLI